MEKPKEGQNQKCELTTYPVATEELNRLQNVFTYHAPKGDQQQRYVLLRDQAKALAMFIVSHVPPGRERALALTKLEESIMHANAGIARNE